MQKNRYFCKPKKIRLIYGDSAFLTSSEGRIELIQLNFLKKRLKKYVIKKDKRFETLKEKIWFYLTPNFLIQKKSKNSRMGKGKGLTERKTIRIKKNIPVFEFKGVSYVFLKRTLKILNKKMSVKLKFIYKNLNKYNTWCSKLKYHTYYNKYLLNRLLIK